jgi:hypothetical protein
VRPFALSSSFRPTPTSRHKLLPYPALVKRHLPSYSSYSSGPSPDIPFVSVWLLIGARMEAADMAPDDIIDIFRGLFWPLVASAARGRHPVWLLCRRLDCSQARACARSVLVRFVLFSMITTFTYPIADLRALPLNSVRPCRPRALCFICPHTLRSFWCLFPHPPHHLCTLSRPGFGAFQTLRGLDALTCDPAPPTIDLRSYLVTAERGDKVIAA